LCAYGPDSYFCKREVDDFNYKGHILIGAAFGASYSYIFNPSYFALLKYPQFWIGTLLGSLILDLDHQGSIINQKILIINKKWFQKLVYVAIGLVAMSYYNFSTNSIIFAALIAMTAFSSHRGFTHRLLGLVLICGAIYICLGITDLTVGLYVGIASHIVADKVHDVIT
jgi:membrane-bound metal-dependent hydrolase YbcI (DUF457 family)